LVGEGVRIRRRGKKNIYLNISQRSERGVKVWLGRGLRDRVKARIGVPRFMVFGTETWVNDDHACKDVLNWSKVEIIPCPLYH
jgi:hypothetical protein